MSARPHLKMLSPEAARPADEPVEAAFKLNARLAFSIAARILGDDADAEDILQDLFIAAARDLRDVGHPAAVRRWFVVATVRLARRRLQRRRFFSAFGGDD